MDIIADFVDGGWVPGYPPRVCLRIVSDRHSMHSSSEVRYELKVSGLDEDVIFYLIPSSSPPGTMFDSTQRYLAVLSRLAAQFLYVLLALSLLLS